MECSQVKHVSPRRRFIDYVRQKPGARTIISPFLPQPILISRVLAYLGIPAVDDPIENEIVLSNELDYEPMFYAPCL